MNYTQSGTFLLAGGKRYTAVKSLLLNPNAPNIRVIVTDDHGLNAALYYGNPEIKIFRPDQLTKEVLKFSKTFCSSASRSAFLPYFITM